MDRIEIICNIDSHFTKYCGVMLTSLFETNVSERFNIHIFATALTDKDIAVLEDIVIKTYGQMLTFHFIGNELPEDLPAIVSNSHINATAYIRCFILPYLPTDMHKALYLDCDMVILGSIHELWDTDITGYALAAVEDQTGTDNSHYSALDLRSDTMYFNSGVLLINLDYWRRYGAQEKMRECMTQYHDRIVQHDQDVLNKVFEGHVLPLPLRWNMQDFVLRRKFRMRHNTIADRNSELPKTVIAHFTGRKKPWHEKCINPFKKDYLKYLDKTQWKGERPKRNIAFRINRLFFPIAGKLGLKNTYINIKK